MRILHAAVLAIWLATPVSGDTFFSELTLAAIRGEADKVAAILQWGGDPNDEGWMGLTPLAAAMRSCAATPETIYVLLKGGADIEGRSGIGATPLMLAWQMGRPDLAEILLALGADPRARNMYGDSARTYELYFSGQLPARAFRTLRYTSLSHVPRSPAGAQQCAQAPG